VSQFYTASLVLVLIKRLNEWKDKVENRGMSNTHTDMK